MTDTDDPPDLDRLEEGDDVKVHYLSKRSGNEVDRTGEFVFTTSNPDDDTTLFWVHTDQPSPLKHQYVVLSKAETTDGDDVVIATSATVAADDPNDGDPPRPGTHHAVQFTAERTSHLGIVDRVMKNGWNINVQGRR
jgi:hypothetical protein